jgi:hypothetical protein
VPTPILYVDLVTLPERCRPALVERAHGRTLMWVDPTATRDETMRWCLRELTAEELVYICTVYGPPQTHLNDRRPVIPVVPDVLRPPRAVPRARSA